MEYILIRCVILYRYDFILYFNFYGKINNFCNELVEQFGISIARVQNFTP